MLQSPATVVSIYLNLPTYLSIYLGLERGDIEAEENIGKSAARRKDRKTMWKQRTQFKNNRIRTERNKRHITKNHKLNPGPFLARGDGSCGDALGDAGRIALGRRTLA